MKEDIVISEDSTAEELAPVALAVNDLLVIPVAMRSKKKGVRVEKGEVIDYDYTGPILERALEENRVIRITPLTGRYARIPVAVTPIRNKKGEVIAALGVVDVVGTVDLGAVFADFPRVLEQIKSREKPKILNVREMNSVLIQNWNNIVKDNTIYFLGDLASRNTDLNYWLNMLTGDIHFIRGNHDRGTNELKEYEILRYKNYKFLLVHDPSNLPIEWDDWVIHGHKHNNDIKNYPFIN